MIGRSLLTLLSMTKASLLSRTIKIWYFRCFGSKTRMTEVKRPLVTLGFIEKCAQMVCTFHRLKSSFLSSIARIIHTSLCQGWTIYSINFWTMFGVLSVLWSFTTTIFEGKKLCFTNDWRVKLIKSASLCAGMTI